jgi:hypothetical protein
MDAETSGRGLCAFMCLFRGKEEGVRVLVVEVVVVVVVVVVEVEMEEEVVTVRMPRQHSIPLQISRVLGQSHACRSDWRWLIDGTLCCHSA